MKRHRFLNVTDFIVSHAHGGRQLPLKDGLMNAFLTALSLGGGASAGRERPAVHLGSTLADAFVTRFSLPPRARRILRGCGVAAAVSASFNVPIAGILFAHEIILRHMAIRAFVPITISSFSATVVIHNQLENDLAFTIPDYYILSYYEFPAFFLLGVLCAFIAIVFMKSCFAADSFAEKISIRFTLPLWSRPALAGVMVGTMGIAFPQALGVGYEATDAVLREGYPLMLLLILIVVKIIATATTFAGRFGGGGIFSPSLYLGAMTGGAFGLGLAFFLPDTISTHGLYAIVGMGAVVASVLGAPLSTSLIIFEMMGDYQLTLALVFTVAIATALTWIIMGKSYFHSMLERQGIFLNDGPHQRILHTVLVGDIMKVADERGNLTDWQQVPQITGQILYANDSLNRALTLMERLQLDSYPVNEVETGDETSRRIIGIVAYHDALKRFNDELVATSLEEHR